MTNQPPTAGVAVAGESTGTSAEGDVMRAVDRVLHPEENRPTTGRNNGFSYPFSLMTMIYHL